MSRSATIVFVCLAIFLGVLPLTLKKPGLPMQLRGLAEKIAWQRQSWLKVND